jgi:DNA-binding NarL/FixJ family response regulator
MSTIRILIADDHALLRAGVRSLLQSVPEFEVVGEANDGREALQLVDTLRPHVLLMDISMPNMNGLMAASKISVEFPEVHVIILSMHTNEEFVGQAIQNGVAGYLLKNAEAAELEFAVKAVARGETYLTPAVSKRMMGDYVDLRNGKPAPKGSQLTPRQTEILQLIAEGRSTKEIAGDLRISVKTVETHRAQLMDRLAIHDIPGLVRYAMRTGLISREV